MDRWKRISDEPPPTGVILETKILDERGERNQGRLKLLHNTVADRKMWFTTDEKMYVYYTPTHWRYP